LNDGKSKKFKSFSGGEKSRIKLAGIIALNKLINNTCEYGKGLNCLILDEIDYLDERGNELVVDIFNKAELTSLVVLHGISDIKHDNIVVVEKRDKNSKIIN